MVFYKVLSMTLLATLVSCEPPVSGYNFQAPRANHQATYNAPSNNYLPPNTGYSASPPNNNYLPPTSFNSGYAATGSGFGSTGSGYSGAGSGYNNHEHHHGHGDDHEVPKSYEFGYSVKDAQSGNDYDRRESSDGNVVRGEYRVQLPDGRTQIVTYHADWQTGFHADVRYEGEAHYPEPNNQKQGGYNYNAPSDFRGSLSGFQGQNSYKPSTAYGPPGYH